MLYRIQVRNHEADRWQLVKGSPLVSSLNSAFQWLSANPNKADTSWGWRVREATPAEKANLA